MFSYFLSCFFNAIAMQWICYLFKKRWLIQASVYDSSKQLWRLCFCIFIEGTSRKYTGATCLQRVQMYPKISFHKPTVLAQCSAVQCSLFSHTWQSGPFLLLLVPCSNVISRLWHWSQPMLKVEKKQHKQTSIVRITEFFQICLLFGTIHRSNLALFMLTKIISSLFCNSYTLGYNCHIPWLWSDRLYK